MTFTTHALAGAALASFMPAHPAAAFAAGVVSHIALDAVPHWNYHPRSKSIDPESPNVGSPLVYDRDLFIDLAVMAADGIAGIVLALFFFGTPGGWISALCGALGGIAPDSLHFIYTRWPHEPVATINNLHIKMQRDIFKNNAFLGVLSQTAVALLIIALAKSTAALL